MKLGKLIQALREMQTMYGDDVEVVAEFLNLHTTLRDSSGTEVWEAFNPCAIEEVEDRSGPGNSTVVTLFILAGEDLVQMIEREEDEEDDDAN